MKSRSEKNEQFLRNIYAKGSFQGHAFLTMPEEKSISELNKGDFTISDKPVEEWVPWVVASYSHRMKTLEMIGDDSVPYAPLGTGTHIYAAAFGCKIHIFENSPPCALPFIKTAEEADKLKEPDIWNSPTLYRIFELARAVQKELGKEVFLGPPDMQSGFDTACLIWNKEDLFCAMMDEEESKSVRRLVDKSAHLFKKFLIEFRKEFPNSSPCHCPSVWAPPEMGPWLSNDECGAISVQIFEEFCLPELIDLSKTFGGLGMHCCADAEHQFDSFKKIPNFYAFNGRATEKGFLDYFGGPDAPVHVLAWIADEDIQRLIQNAPDGTRFIFEFYCNTIDDARVWYEKMRTLSPRTEGE